MNVHVKKKVRFATQPVGKPSSEINITPLVDVVLVLLIIFMVITPLLEKDIEVHVPDDQQQVDDQDVPQDQLVVSLDVQGNISINSEKIAPDQYIEKLKRMVFAKPQGQRLVFFTADDQTNYGKVVHALDGARKAGAEILGMVTEPLPQNAITSAPGTTTTVPASTQPPSKP